MGGEAKDLLVGSVLDRRYQIEARLAAGGFGTIYRAKHVISARDVALKVLHTKLATEPDVVARFRREGAALAKLRDPHTVTAYDFGEADDGTLYIVMELLRGQNLHERFLSVGAMPWRQVLAIARQVCSSLAEAHALGIVHRDLKPTNIHLETVDGNPDFVKVLDFGIAKILHGSQLDNSDLTSIGRTIGTFDYMAPEQMVGGATTRQTDIFTLGVVMYEMIVGERPYGDAATPAAMLAAIMSRTIAPISTRSDAPDDLDLVINRCLDSVTANRFASVEELDNELEYVLTTADATKTTISPPPDLAGSSASWSSETLPTQRAHPHSTLPGVAPPSRDTPWPIVDPSRKKP